VKKIKMKKYYYRQGDILLEKVDNVVDDCEKIQDNNNNIIAHGESGNQHRMNQQVVIFEDRKTKERFVQVMNQDTELVHQEHKPIQIPKGLYKIRREREYNAFEQSIRQVID
jgi:hypothetical protein